MTRDLAAAATNIRWEFTRWRRSRRIWLLVIPPVAGPLGSAIADLFLRVPSVGTAEILGLLITGGLSGLVILDLSALAVGEELATREYLITLSLPQRRSAALVGRLTLPIVGPVAAYGAGAALVFLLAPVTVTVDPLAAGPLFVPTHLGLALVALLLFLGGVAAAAAAVTRSAAQGLVAGVLGGVLVAGLVSLQVFQRQVTWLSPTLVAVSGLAALAFAVRTYASLEA